MAQNETEEETRKNRIDQKLSLADWDVNNVKKVLQEVDTVNSDFDKKIFKYKNETLSKKEKAYADYVLLDSHGSPIAVIEAKRASIHPDQGQKQAEMYVEQIKKQYSKDGSSSGLLNEDLLFEEEKD